MVVLAGLHVLMLAIVDFDVAAIFSHAPKWKLQCHNLNRRTECFASQQGSINGSRPPPKVVWWRTFRPVFRCVYAVVAPMTAGSVWRVWNVTLLRGTNGWSDIKTASGSSINLYLVRRHVEMYTDSTRLHWPALLDSCLLVHSWMRCSIPRGSVTNHYNFEALVFLRDELSSAPRFNTSSETTALGRAAASCWQYKINLLKSCTTWVRGSSHVWLIN